jgi:DNA helicase HerA-like ATPase
VLRLTLAVAALSLLSYALGFAKLEYSLALAVLSITPLLVFLIKGRLRLPSIRIPSGGSYSGLGGVSFRVLEVEVKSRRDSVASGVAKVISDRASKGGVRYVFLSLLEGDLRRSLILLASHDPGRLEVEAEVLKSILSSLVEDVRVYDVNVPELAPLARWALDAKVHSRGLILISESTMSSRHPFRGNPHGGDPSIYLGEVLDKPYPKPFTLEEVDLEGHIGVFGSTGSGKSTTLSILSERAWSQAGIPVLILDWTGEHSALLKARGAPFKEYNPSRGEASINPLDLSSDLDYLVSVMVKALSLSPPQAYMLLKALEQGRPRNLRELEAAIEVLSEESKWDREVKRALLRKIGMLTRGSYEAFKETRGVALEGINVIRLDYMRNILARRSYALFILAGLFMERSSGVEGPKVLIAIDEAHNIFNGEEAAFIEQLFSESRKYGIILAIATQSPSSIPNGVLLNTNTKIVHALRSARDKSIIAETMSLPRDYVEILDKLGPGEAIVQSPSNPQPLLIQVQLVNELGDELDQTGIQGKPVNPNTGIPELKLR